ETESSAGLRRQFGQAVDFRAESFGTMRKRFDIGAVARGHVNREQPCVRMLTQCQHMMFHARAAQMNRTRFTDDFGQTPDVTIEPDGFCKISHTEFDAANSDHSGLNHRVMSSWRRRPARSLDP